MRQIIILLVMIATLSHANAQKRINLIVSVDDRIVKNLSGFEITIMSNSGEKKNIKAKYSPGNLLIDELDYEKLLDSTINTIDLSFLYNEYTNNDIIEYSYDIQIDKQFAKQNFILLYVYNTNKKKYRGLYKPMKGKKYVYEYDFPTQGVRRSKFKNKK